MKNRLIGLLLAALISSALAGCQTLPGEVLPNRGPLIEEIYLGVETSDLPLKRDVHAISAEELQDIQDEICAVEELQKRFPRLANPTLYMYVYPHVTELDAVPIPGYLTYFPLYESVVMALPGEPSELAIGLLGCEK